MSASLMLQIGIKQMNSAKNFFIRKPCIEGLLIEREKAKLQAK